jgi:hypothetical protein
LSSVARGFLASDSTSVLSSSVTRRSLARPMMADPLWHAIHTPRVYAESRAQPPHQTCRGREVPDSNLAPQRSRHRRGPPPSDHFGPPDAPTTTAKEARAAVTSISRAMRRRRADLTARIDRSDRSRLDRARRATRGRSRCDGRRSRSPDRCHRRTRPRRRSHRQRGSRLGHGRLHPSHDRYRAAQSNRP